MSRSGGKAAFARWEQEQTKKHGQPISEFTAKIGRDFWKIEVSEQAGGAVFARLYLWDDLRGFIAMGHSSRLQELQNRAETLSRNKESRGVAKIERIANYSRDGGKARFANLVTEAQSLSSELDRDTQTITDRRSAKKDRAILAELVKAYLAGDYSRTANRWSALSMGSRVTAQGQDIKRRLEWSGYHFSRDGGKAQFGLERSISIMLSDAKIPDSAFDWRGGSLIVDPEYHDRIVEVLKGYIPSELKSLPRIRKEQMSRSGGKARFSDPIANKIALLMDEGKDRDQAVAIATDMKKRGEL